MHAFDWPEQSLKIHIQYSTCFACNNAHAHNRGGGGKKWRVFPQKVEFGASVASLFVQPDTTHPPDHEGLGPQ